jgi:hypothetical protein
VFNYIILCVVLVILIVLIIFFVVGLGLIHKLTQYKINQSIRNNNPQTHLIKTSTPTINSTLILVTITISTLL